MSNEVNKDTEETAAATASVKEETVLDNSAEMADDEQSSGEMDFGAILEQFEQEQTMFSSGELVTGKVVGVSERGILVDFGYKSEGIVANEEFTSPEGEITVKPGDEIEVVIRSMDSGDNPPTLSHLDAQRRKSWVEIEEAYKEGNPITGRVVEKTKGGLKVDIGGVEAFLPGSQVDSRPIRNLDPYIGQDIETKVIKFSRKRNNIVLSRKVLTDEVVNAQKAETLNQIEEGFIVEGKVKSLTEYGAFVDLGGIDGLLHVTDMSWGRLQNPNQLFKVGDSVQVKVLKLDREKEKVSLGYKQLLPDPWSTVGEVYPIGAKLKGKVSSVTDYGAFIELEPGVEGLVHVSEMSWSKRAKHPKNLVNPGDEVEVQVLGIDTRDRRISLGMKQLQENPWDSIASRYHVGSKVHGRVRNLTDFGAFIEVEDGVDGLVHVSDISWSKKIKHPKDALKKGQEVDAVVTNIDTEGRRLSLSIKELTPSAWDAFVSTHRTGDVVKGKVSRFANFGVFVELGDDLEGLCHISELSDERVERPEQVVSIGQEMDFKILRIEYDVQKIGLSARAVGKEDEPQVDTKFYSTEAKGGMASLAELANLKFGREPDEETKESPKEEKAAKEEPKTETAEVVEETAVEDEKGEETASETTEAVTAEVESEAANSETSEDAEADKE
jgi:small subunit ribosomal protein S1